MVSEDEQLELGRRLLDTLHDQYGEQPRTTGFEPWVEAQTLTEPDRQAIAILRRHNSVKTGVLGVLGGFFSPLKDPSRHERGV